MEVKANMNRLGKISQIKPLHLEVSFSFTAKKCKTHITLFQAGEISSGLIQLQVYAWLNN